MSLKTKPVEKTKRAKLTREELNARKRQLTEESQAKATQPVNASYMKNK